MPSVEQIQTHVPTSFKWTEEWGSHICIAGSFDPPIPTWSPIEMQKNKDNIHEVTLDLLPDKKFFYKFVVDGNWVLDRNIPSCPDSSGNWNHEIQVELPPPPPPTPPTPEETKEEMKEEMKEGTKEEMKEEMKEEVNEEMKEEVNEEMKEEVKEEMKEEVKEEMKEEVVVSEQLQQEVVIEEHKKEEVIAEETHEEMIVTEELQIEKHQEDQVMVEETHEEVIVTEELQIEKHQEDQVIVEDHKEEHHHDHQTVAEDHKIEQQHHEDQTVAEDHKIEQQHHEDQVVNEVKEEQNQYQEDHHVDENKQHQQEEQVVVEDKEQHQHQEDHHIVAEDHQMDENKQQHQEQEVMVENTEQQNQHQEDHQVVEELNQHHHEDDQKEQHHEDQIVTEINTTEQSCDDTVVTNESIINETMVSETITNETMVSETIINEESIIKETIIESDNDKLSAEHVAKESHDESMTNETLHTHPEPIDVSISHENVEEVTPQHKVTEISEVLNIEQSENLVNEFKVTEETSSTVGEKYETVVSSTTEIEKPIESSEINEKVHEPEYETINENDDDENVEDYDHENEGAEDIENIVSETYDEVLNPETLKEVLLNNTWAKDDTLEDAITSSWTESHTSQSVIWPDDTNLEWSDINKDETTISKEIETTNKFETEFEDYSEHMSEETRVTEITSTNVEEEVISHEIPSTVLVEETITGQTGSIVEEISAQSIVESHIEHKTEESDETGINKVSTSEVAELSFEKPESSATADKNMMSIPTTVVAAPAVGQQHSYLDEEIVTSQEIDKSKLDDVLKDNNISRKIISISPSSTSSPGESTRNADIYPHNITLATNTSRETVNIKSKHKKPVVEITSKIIIQHDGEEEEKIDLNDIAYLVTSVATTFTLGIISMLYKSVFGPGTKNQ